MITRHIPKRTEVYPYIKHPIHFACGTDELRPALEHIYFHNDRIYATDAHLAVRIPFNDVFFLTQPPNGKCISHRSWMWAMNKRYLISDEGILLTDYDCMLRFNDSEKLMKDFPKLLTYIDEKFSNFEHNKSVNEMAFNTTLVNRLGKILRNTHLHFEFDQPNKCILVSENKRDASPCAILMPIMINP